MHFLEMYGEGERVCDGPIGYNFEPQLTDAQLREFEARAHPINDDRSSRSVRPESSSRRLTLDWCRCGKCQIMRKEEECLCCRELPALFDIFQSTSETVQCITSVPDFKPVCLNESVLRASYAGMADMKHRGENVTAVPRKLENRTYRLLAYRNFTGWIHGKLGIGVRKVIPACAVLRIRETFPEADGNYVGFITGDQNEPEYNATWILELDV